MASPRKSAENLGLAEGNYRTTHGGSPGLLPIGGQRMASWRPHPWRTLVQKDLGRPGVSWRAWRWAHVRCKHAETIVDRGNAAAAPEVPGINRSHHVGCVEAVDDIGGGTSNLAIEVNWWHWSPIFELGAPVSEQCFDRCP